MRDGERLVRCLTFQEVDRPPYYQPFLGWDLTHEQWQREAGVRRLNLMAYFNLDYGFETVPVPLGMFPPFERMLIEEKGESYIERDERGILMRQRRDKGSIPGFLEHPVKGWEEWEPIKKERFDPDHPGRYHAGWEAFNGHLGRSSTVGPGGSALTGLESATAAGLPGGDVVPKVSSSKA